MTVATNRNPFPFIHHHEVRKSVIPPMEFGIAEIQFVLPISGSEDVIADALSTIEHVWIVW